MGYGASSKSGGGSCTAGGSKKTMKQGKPKAKSFTLKAPADPVQKQQAVERKAERAAAREAASSAARSRTPPKPVNGTQSGGQTLSGRSAVQKQQARAAGQTRKVSQQVPVASH